MSWLRVGVWMLAAVLLLATGEAAEAGGFGGWRPCGFGAFSYLVPQGAAGADFRRACQRHDQCYGKCLPRGYCDEQFGRDMCQACRHSRCPMYCRTVAWTMYKTTKWLGFTQYGR